MNFLLHKYNVPPQTVVLPKGIKELIADISREVLREQPPKIYDYIADYLEGLILVREHAYIAQKTLDNLLDFNLNVVDMLENSGLDMDEASKSAKLIAYELELFAKEPCVTKFDEKLIIQKLISECGLRPENAENVKSIIQIAFKDYFYRRISHQNSQFMNDTFGWKEAVKRTLDVYKKSCPEQSAMDRAAVIIQSAYRGFFVRKGFASRKNLEYCALTIQKCYRGFSTRKRLKE